MNINSLSELLRNCPYPPQMERIECGILGRGFYPGTKGFHNTESPLDGIILLGRDFGTKAYYESLCGPPAKDETAWTWLRTKANYLKNLEGLPVWCTNYLLGVRKQGPSTGNVKKRIDSLEWNAFESHCWRFLQAQVLLQRPRIVIILGADNKSDLELQDRLGHIPHSGLRYKFQTEDGYYHSAVVVAADHPFSLISKASQSSAIIACERFRRLYKGEV